MDNPSRSGHTFNSDTSLMTPNHALKFGDNTRSSKLLHRTPMTSDLSHVFNPIFGPQPKIQYSEPLMEKKTQLTSQKRTGKIYILLSTREQSMYLHRKMASKYSLDGTRPPLDYIKFPTLYPPTVGDALTKMSHASTYDDHVPQSKTSGRRSTTPLLKLTHTR